MLTQDKDLPAHLGHDFALVLRSAVLQDVLNHIVTVLVLRGVFKRHTIGHSYKKK